MQNQSMMTPGAQFLSTWLQLDFGTGRNAVATERGGWEAKDVGPGQAQSIKRVKRRNARGIQVHIHLAGRTKEVAQSKWSKVAVLFLSLSYSFYLCLSLSLSSSTLSCLCVYVLLHFLRLSRVALLKCPFLLANQANQNGYWPTNRYHIIVYVCVCVFISVCVDVQTAAFSDTLRQVKNICWLYFCCFPWTTMSQLSGNSLTVFVQSLMISE